MEIDYLEGVVPHSVAGDGSIELEKHEESSEIMHQQEAFLHLCQQLESNKSLVAIRSGLKKMMICAKLLAIMNEHRTHYNR